MMINIAYHYAEEFIKGKHKLEETLFGSNEFNSYNLKSTSKYRKNYSIIIYF